MLYYILPTTPFSFNAFFSPCCLHSLLICSHCLSVHTIDLFTAFIGFLLMLRTFSRNYALYLERSKHFLAYYDCPLKFHFSSFVSLIDLFSGLVSRREKLDICYESGREFYTLARTALKGKWHTSKS